MSSVLSKKSAATPSSVLRSGSSATAVVYFSRDGVSFTRGTCSSVQWSSNASMLMPSWRTRVTTSFITTIERIAAVRLSVHHEAMALHRRSDADYRRGSYIRVVHRSGLAFTPSAEYGVIGNHDTCLLVGRIESIT